MVSNDVKFLTGFCTYWPPERSGLSDTGLVYCYELEDKIIVHRDQLLSVGKNKRLYKGEKVTIKSVESRNGALYGIFVKPIAIELFYSVAENVIELIEQAQSECKDSEIRTRILKTMESEGVRMYDIYMKSIPRNRAMGLPTLMETYRQVKLTLLKDFSIKIEPTKERKPVLRAPGYEIQSNKFRSITSLKNARGLIATIISDIENQTILVNTARKGFHKLVRLAKDYKDHEDFIDEIIDALNKLSIYLSDFVDSTNPKISLLESYKLAYEIKLWLRDRSRNNTSIGKSILKRIPTIEEDVLVISQLTKRAKNPDISSRENVLAYAEDMVKSFRGKETTVRALRTNFKWMKKHAVDYPDIAFEYLSQVVRYLKTRKCGGAGPFHAHDVLTLASEINRWLESQTKLIEVI